MAYMEGFTLRCILSFRVHVRKTEDETVGDVKEHSLHKENKLRIKLVMDVMKLRRERGCHRSVDPTYEYLR